MDPKVNGQIQKEWGWLVAAYFFLAGVGAGAYVIAAINGFAGETVALSTLVGLWISFPAVALGTFCLLADLGNPLKAVLAGLKPGTSWIARGFWILLALMLVAFIHTILLTFTSVGAGAGIIKFLSVVGIILAVATMAYTGVLLSASKGMPFWRSGVVPVLFVISAVVTGHFSIMILMPIFDPGPQTAVELIIMAAEAAALVVFEVLAILFFLQQAYRHPDAKESAERILRHYGFLLGYFVVGLAVPLLLMLVVYRLMTHSDPVDVFIVATIGAALGLIGGLILRYSVLVFGALPTWNVAGFKFRRIARPKEAKAGIGLLPPA